MSKKRRNVILVVLAATFIVSACAPAPGVAPSAHWPAPVGTDVPEAVRVLERDAGGQWQALYVDAAGRTVLGTVGASVATARKAHGRLCGWDWGKTAALFEKAASKGCAGSSAPIFDPENTSGFTVKQTGGASFYEDRSVLAFPKFRNARGCAHKTLSAGTTVRLRYKGKYTSCVVDDRGPYVSGRVIDLQAKQFAELAPLSAGVISGVELSW
jgi:hypothetical protein